VPSRSHFPGRTAIFLSSRQDGLDVLFAVCARILMVVATVAALALEKQLEPVFLAQFVGGGGALALAMALWRRLARQTLGPSWVIVRHLRAQGTPLNFFITTVAVRQHSELSRLSPPGVVGYNGAARNILGFVVVLAAIRGTAAFSQMSWPALHPVELHGLALRQQRETCWICIGWWRQMLRKSGTLVLCWLKKGG
jgi:hypothetical protein